MGGGTRESAGLTTYCRFRRHVSREPLDRVTDEDVGVETDGGEEGDDEVEVSHHKRQVL